MTVAAAPLAIVPVRGALPAGFDTLQSEARAEGHTHMDRLAADWASGALRFDRPGEALLAALQGAELTGVGGITADTADPAALRLRRFYVRPAFRRHGVGRALARPLIGAARRASRRVVLNAPATAAAFWEALGFVPEPRDGHTHASTWPGA